MSEVYDEVDLLIERDFGHDAGMDWGLRRRKAGGHSIKNKYNRQRKQLETRQLIEAELEEME